MVTVTKFRRVVMKEPSGDQSVGGSSTFTLARFARVGSQPQAITRRQRFGVSKWSALRLVRIESISVAISSNFARRALSLTLALIHLSISVLVAFWGEESSRMGQRSPMM